MILDNEEIHDLDRYHELMKYKPIPADRSTGDVINLMYYRLNDNRSFMIDDTIVPFGDYLKFLREKYLNGECSQEFFSKEDKFAIKACTFLADLTKRIMNQNAPIYSTSQDRIRVMMSGIENLKRLSLPHDTAYYFMLDAFNNSILYQKIAGSFNRLIQKSMEHYL